MKRTWAKFAVIAVMLGLFTVSGCTVTTDDPVTSYSDYLVSHDVPVAPVDESSEEAEPEVSEETEETTTTPVPTTTPAPTTTKKKTTPAPTTTKKKTEPVKPDPSKSVTERVNELYASMTLEERVCQMIIVRDVEAGGATAEEIAKKYPIGGVCIFQKPFSGLTAKQVRAKTAGYSKGLRVPAIVSVDEEGGTVVRLSSNKNLRSSKFKSPSALYKEGGLDRIRKDTKEKCAFLRDLGVNVNFAPLADVVTSKEAFLCKRAFGIGTKETAEYVGTVVAEMKNGRVASFVKHFPGYGNSKGDTHKDTDVNTKSLAELEKTDLPPFVAGFKAGADGVMVTHTVMNAIDPDAPATMSPAVYNYIRNDMGFNGIIVTDGLDMAAVTKYCGKTDPALKAIQAGADLALLPPDSAKSCKALIDAAKSGKLSESRIETSVKRILRLKARLGLI